MKLSQLSHQQGVCVVWNPGPGPGPGLGSGDCSVLWI